MSIKFLILLTVVLVGAPFIADAQINNSRFTKVTLAAEITAEFPTNWWLVNAQWNNTLLTAVEAKLDLANVVDVTMPKSTLISLRSMPEETYASIRIDYYKGGGQAGRSRELSDSDIKILDEKLQETMPKVIDSERILMWNGTQNVVVADRPATVTHYLRTGPKGPVMVWIHDISLLNGDSLVIDSAMRASEADLWEAVLKKCIGSLKIGKKPSSIDAAELRLMGATPPFVWEFPKGWHSPRKIPGKLGFAQFHNRMMSIIIESTTDTATSLNDLKSIAREKPRFLFETIVATRPDSTFIETKETIIGSLEGVQTSIYYNLSTPGGSRKIFCCITTTVVGYETFVVAFECLAEEMEEGVRIMRDALEQLEFRP